MLTKRSAEKELIDLGPEYYSETEYQACLNKLFSINQLLGFFSSTVSELKKYKVSSLLDIGCGSGLTVLNLSRKFPNMVLQGNDISPQAIALADSKLKTWHKNNLSKHVNFELKSKDDFSLPANQFDVILATLVCHHLTDAELITFLQSAKDAARKVVLIYDLHRHPLAIFCYRIISPFFRNRLISHDGLISIRRGFKRSEWEFLLNQAGIKHYQIKWQFPFRWSVMIWKK